MAKKEEIENMAGSERLKALQAAMDKIEKNFGKGSLMKLGDDNFESINKKLLELNNNSNMLQQISTELYKQFQLMQNERVHHILINFY